MSRRVVVVGGGAIGCTTALRLVQAGCSVTLLEAATELGGLASSWSLDAPTATSGSVVWDRFYHVILESDSAWRSVLKELELDHTIVWSKTRTGACSKGVTRSVSSPLDLLRFTPLSLISRIRVGITVVVASRLRDGHSLELRPLEPWLKKWSGRKAFEKFWRPQLRAKLGAQSADVSVAFIWATAQRLLRARRSGVGTERFGYVPGGYATILGRFQEALVDAGVVIRTQAKVRSIESSERDDAPTTEAGRVVVTLCDGTAIRADDAVLTVPASRLGSMLGGCSQTELHRLDEIRFQGVICVSLLLCEPLSPFYLTYLLDESVLTGIVDMSALVGGTELGGHGLVYLPRYQSPDDPLFDAADDDVIEMFVKALGQAYPEFDRGSVVSAKVARAREVFAVPTLGYSALVPPTSTSIPGVWLITSAQIEQATLNVDESVRVAESGVKAVLRERVRT